MTRDEAAFIVADLSTVWVTSASTRTPWRRSDRASRSHIVAGHGTEEAEGRVSYISPVVDQATRTASARVVLPNPDGAWRPGLFVTATVCNPVAAPVVIPRRAVQTFEGRPTVFVGDGERFEPRRSRSGASAARGRDRRSGLAPGERFADERSFLVKAELAKGEAGHHH